MNSLLRFIFISLLFSSFAHAQTYPSRSVRIIVGFTPGGVTDVTARIVAQKLTEMWGQNVVVENRPGASGIIGAEATAKAAPDGYTLLISPQTSTSVATTLYPKLPYDVLKDFAIITVVGSSPQLLVLHPSLPPLEHRDFCVRESRNRAIDKREQQRVELPHAPPAPPAQAARSSVHRVE